MLNEARVYREGPFFDKQDNSKSLSSCAQLTQFTVNQLPSVVIYQKWEYFTPPRRQFLGRQYQIFDELTHRLLLQFIVAN